MAENNSENNKPQGFQKRRPNASGNGFQGWLVIGLVVALISIYFLSKTKVLKPIQQTQYEQMVLNQEIAKLSIIKGKDLVEITLKPEALPKYKNELNDQPNTAANPSVGPQFEKEITSINSFETELNELQKDIPREKRVHATTEEHYGILDFFMGPGFIILTFVAIYFMFFKTPSTFFSGSESVESWCECFSLRFSSFKVTSTLLIAFVSEPLF